MNDNSSTKKQEGLGRKHQDSKIKKKDEVKQLKSRNEDLENQLKRAIADYRNLEKRFEDEKSATIKFANRDLLMRIIPAFDTLFLAEKYVTDEGIKITIKHLQESLREQGVEKIQTEDQIFNPETMEAVTTGDGEENKVLEELRPGYTLNSKLIRPAQVKVGKAKSV